MPAPQRNTALVVSLALMMVATLAGVSARPVAHAQQARSFWRVDSVPVTKIGGANANPAYLVTSIWNVARTFEGYLAVVDDEFKRVRIFDSSGNHVATHGRLGQGPGEFDREHLVARSIARDTIGVYGSYSGKLQVFSIRNGFVRTELFSGPGTVSRDRNVEESATLLDGGSFLIFSTPVMFRERMPTGVVTRTPYQMSWKLRGRNVRDLGAFPGEESLLLPGADVGLPFGATLARGWDPSGTTVCLGDTMNARIQCFDSAGGARSIAWNQRAEPITDSVVAEWKARLVGRITPEARRVLDAARLKSTKPAFSSLFVDTDLNVWVDIPSKRAVGQKGRTFSVFARTGQFLGDVEMPSMDVKQIHADVVVGVTYDVDDVGTVVVHRIRKNP